MGLVFIFIRPPRLRAEQFVPGNQDHLEILKSMGITVAQTKEGRIQLMHSASNVSLLFQNKNLMKVLLSAILNKSRLAWINT